MQSGRFADAVRQYESLLATHPDSPEVLFALGACFIELGRSNEAVSKLRRYVGLVPGAANGHAALGIALLDAADAAAAKTSLQKALELNPAQANAIEALARLHLVEGTPDQAVALLRPWMESPAAPGSPELEQRLLFAEALIRAGSPKPAAALLDRELAGSDAASVQTYVLAGWAHIKSDEPERAAEICEEGMRRYPDSEIEGVYLSLPGPLLAQRTAMRLERLKTDRKISELIALGRVLADVDPEKKTRALEISRELLSQAVAAAPANASARYNYGRALWRTSMSEALREWERALTLDPDDDLKLQILTQVAKARDSLSDFGGAEEAFRAAMEVNRRLRRRVPEAGVEFVRFLQLRSERAEAEKVLTEILSWNPWSPDARVERARMFADDGRWQEVVMEAEFVLRNASDDRELLRIAHLLLARAYYRLEQPEKAQVHRDWLEGNVVGGR